jgi:alkaline phosphatase
MLKVLVLFYMILYNMRKLLYAALFLMPALGVSAQENYKDVTGKYVYTNDAKYPVQVYDSKQATFKGKPKNIILLIGDGMGVTQVFSGLTGNGGMLNLVNMKSIGFSKTQSANKYVTDSAAGGTALACGVKTYNGAIGVGPDSSRIVSILELGEQHGKATGLVATSAITHATPASFIAHVASRSSYEDIALSFLETEIDVFIGGGKSFFEKRKDGRNLISELEARNYKIFDKIDDAKSVTSGKLGILTAPEHNGPATERGDMLEKATEKAISVLSQNSKKGFFLMVEGSQIDWGGHQNDAGYVVTEMLDFDRAIGKALEFAVKDRNTLVIVTADHETGGMSVVGGNMKEGTVKTQFGTSDHSAVMVPVFAFGPGASEFQGIYENVEVFNKMKTLFGF